MTLELTLNQDHKNPQHTTLAFSGTLGEATFKEINRITDQISIDCRNLTVDLTKVNQLNSLGLGSLVKLRHEVAAHKPSLIVKKDSVVETMLELAHFDDLFCIKNG